jgi:hypothetical protein
MLLRVLIDCCRVRQDLALENLVLRYQLEVMLKPCLRNRDRILLVWLRWLWPEGWTRQLRIVQPETVIGWHRSGWRLYRTWRSRTRLGRPRLTAEVRELIARMSQENRLWGTERIRELEAPVPSPPMSGAVVVSRAILGGPRHAYGRAA